MLEFQQELDARNESCPTPVMKTKNILKNLAAGEILHVMATDPFSVKDITVLMQSQPAKILATNKEDGIYHFYIKHD